MNSRNLSVVVVYDIWIGNTQWFQLPLIILETSLNLQIPSFGGSLVFGPWSLLSCSPRVRIPDDEDTGLGAASFGVAMGQVLVRFFFFSPFIQFRGV